MPHRGVKSGGRKQDLNGSTSWNLPLPPVNKPIEVLSYCLDMEYSTFLWNFFEC